MSVPAIVSLQFHLAEDAVPGGVEAWLREQRQAGVSFAEIAFELRASYGVRVTDQTIRNWAHTLGIGS